MEGVFSRVFLILESGLCKDGKRNEKAGGESSGAGREASQTRTSFCTLPAFAGAKTHRATARRQERWAQGWRSHSVGGSRGSCGEVVGLAGRGEMGRTQLGPTTKAASWKHL